MAPIVSRVRRKALAETIRNHRRPPPSSGKMRNVNRASLTSSTSRITTVPRSVSPAWNSVTTESVTRLSSASTSLVMREISTPAGRLS